VSPHAICELLPDQLAKPFQCILRKEALLKNQVVRSELIIVDSEQVTRSVKVTKLVEDRMISCCLSAQQKK
jgi:hypothetical protein